MAATATATVPNGMINPNGRSNLTQAFMELGADMLSISSSRAAMGATTNSAAATTQTSKAVLSHAQGRGVVSEDDMQHALRNGGFSGGVLNGGVFSNANIRTEMIQAADAAAEVVKRANIQGTPTKEQIEELTQQAMKSSEVRASIAQTKSANPWKRLYQASAVVGSVTGGAAIGGTAFVVKAAVETVKMFAGKGSFSAVVNSALKWGAGGAAGGALLAAVPFGAAAISRAKFNNKRERAMSEIVAKAVENAAHGKMPRSQARQVSAEPARAPAQQEPVQGQQQTAAAAAPQEPIVAPDAPKPDAPKQEQAVATTVAAATAAATVAARAPEGRVKDKGVPVNQFYQQVQRAIEQGNQMNKDQPAAGAPAAAPAATAEKVAAAIKPDFGIKSSYGTMAYGGDVKLGMGGAIPGKTPEIKGVKVEAKIG